MHAGTFECARALWGASGYFRAHAGTFGHVLVLFGTRMYFWAHAGAFGHVLVLLGTRMYFWSDMQKYIFFTQTWFEPKIFYPKSA